MALPAADDGKRQFSLHHVVDTHIRKTGLSVMYTNSLIWVENSIHTMEQLLAEDDKYKVVGFDLHYTGGRAGHDRKVAVAQLCVRHHVLIYHYFMATEPCICFARFVNHTDYRFAMVDTINDLKVLKTSGITCQNLVDIQGQYKI